MAHSYGARWLLEAAWRLHSSHGYGFFEAKMPSEKMRLMGSFRGAECEIVDADVSGYFDSIDRTRLREVLRKRINDGSILRLIGKWLRAGVMEQGALTPPETGVVPGGVIAPVLANVFLHHVLDAWFEGEVRPRMQGRCFLLRFADDCAPRRREGVHMT
jgi:RNA-directed DNA polymerase